MFQRFCALVGPGDEKIYHKKVFKNQIFFVANGRFTREEIEAYDLLSSIIFDKEVINYTTIVRVNFSDFEDYEKCANDRASLRMENAGLAYILNKVNIVYVDNPPLVGRAREINKEVREVPRKRLLTYLGTCQNTYRLSNLDTLNERIRKYANNQTPKGQKVANIHQTIANLQEQINELGLEASRIN
uniref:AIG1-type G domain-containing protein n=1 Tax=Rhizophagus irregularis (strain DAOM 181602 / DAOM 197198 / MUCL 43194) TaxID=747089 RepID=U9U6Q8_RHIID